MDVHKTPRPMTLPGPGPLRSKGWPFKLAVRNNTVVAILPILGIGPRADYYIQRRISAISTRLVGRLPAPILCANLTVFLGKAEAIFISLCSPFKRCKMWGPDH